MNKTEEMGPIEIAADLKRTYIDRNANEADTRVKIIDTIIFDILAWPKESLFCEKKLSEGRLDYVLYNKNNKPVIIIEAKKEGKYFTLPSYPNTKNPVFYRSIKVKELLTDENIKEAVLQAKGYCEEEGCNYGCITNGHEWVVFHVNPQSVPWKSLSAYVITDLEYFSANFTEARNMFGYNAIVNEDSLRKNIGQVRPAKGQLFYPKSSITIFDIPVTNNKYANIFRIIGRKYLGNIPMNDHDFMENCYVSNRGYYDSLQKNVNGFIYDSLTPYFRSEGVKELKDIADNGGELTKSIEESIKRNFLDSVMILFGGRGSGKSTFIERLLFHKEIDEIKNYSRIAIVNLISSTQNTNELNREIWEKVCSEIDKDQLLSSDRETLLELYSDEFNIFRKQFLTDIATGSSHYGRTVNKFISEKKADVKYSAYRLSVDAKKKNKGLIIVLDNMDQLSPELQDVAFLTATEVAKKLSCLVIISMREERYFNVKSRGVLDAYHTNGFHLSSPVIPEVIIKRFTYILNKINFSNNLRVDFDMTSEQEKEIVDAFIKICLKELKNDNTVLSTFIRYSTQGDVRQALGYIISLLTSGYTQIDEITENRRWTFQKHQVLKPMMTPDRFFYDERASLIPNLYQIRDEKYGSHFTGLRILHYLNNKNYEKIHSGFVDIRYLIQYFDTTYDLRKDCEKNLDILLTRGLIESDNRIDAFVTDVDKVRITGYGKYMLESLAHDFTYLDLISLDCGIFDESLFNKFTKSAVAEYTLYTEHHFVDRIILRLDRTEDFINYLLAQEEQEIIDLNLSSREKRFVPNILSKFQVEKERVLKSARNKKSREDKYGR